MLRINFSFFAGICLSCACFAQDDLLKQKQDETFELIFTNQAKAILVIDSLILAYKDNQGFKQAKNYSNKGVYYGVQNELDSAAYYFNKAVALTPENHQFYPKLLNNLSIIYKKKGNYKEAINNLNIALEIANKQNNSDGKSRIYSELASIYRSLNEYNLAVEYSINTLDILKNQDTINEYYLYSEKQKLANLYRTLDKNKFAIKLYEEILPYFDNAIYTDAKISTYINYAAALIKIDNFEKAIIFLNKANDELVNFENGELEAFYNLIYANYYSKIGKINEAEESFEAALSKFTKLKDNYPKTLIEYLNFLKNQKAFNKIIDYITISENLDNLQVGFKNLKDYHKILGLAYENTGDYTKSLYHYKIHIKYTDSLNQQSNYVIAKDLQSKYQNQILTQENKFLQQENIIQSKTKLIILISSISLISIFLILLIRYKSKIEAARKLQEISDQKIKAEEELIDIKDALLKEQKKELLSRSFLINKLNKDIQFVKKNMGAENEMVKQRLNDVDQFISPTHEINKLRYEFERVYPNFYQDIKKEYPKLNKNDALFLSFIKLKFSYKEIANILNITHKSAITKKYRIAKKMNLDNNEDFYEFVEKKL